jgi:hypothetical protein
MTKYLGSNRCNVESTPYCDYSTNDWILEYVERYGQYDGAHHKQWVLDQIARIVKGTKVIVNLAKWDDGTEEYRITLDEPSKEYIDWVETMRGNLVDDEYEYDYDEGTAP